MENKILVLFFYFVPIFLVNGEVHWSNKVVDKIVALIEDPLEQPQILLRLSKEEEFQGSYEKSSVWKMLNMLMNNDKAFKSYAQLLIAEDDEKIKRIVEELYEEFHLVKAKASDTISPQVKLSDLFAASAAGIPKMMKSLSPELKAKILAAIPHLLSMNVAAIPVSALRIEVLANVYLTAETLQNIYRWWRGEISGKRAAKNVVDSVATIGGGYIGANLGAAILSVFGPIGAGFGGAVGAVAGSYISGKSSDWLTREFFDLPKSLALENAYEALRIGHQAPNSEINKAFRMLSMKFHPDRPGGSHDIFTKLQFHMAVIKAARGE